VLITFAGKTGLRFTNVLILHYNIDFCKWFLQVFLKKFHNQSRFIGYFRNMHEILQDLTPLDWHFGAFFLFLYRVLPLTFNKKGASFHITKIFCIIQKRCFNNAFHINFSCIRTY